MLNVLVTGASGFLGSAIALHLLGKGYRLALLLRPTSQLSRLNNRELDFNLCRYKSDKEIEDFISSIKPDVVVHTACSYGRRGESAVSVSDANLRFGLMVMQAVMRLNKPVTFINTGTVLDADVSFYALTKQQFSHCGRFLAAQCPCQLRFINVLLQHMYGSGDSQTKFTTRVLRACYRNEFSLELTSGEQKRDFIYIDDVVSAYSTLIEQRAKFSNIEDIEVGSGTASTIREFVDIVHNATASRTLLRFGALPYRRNEPMFLQADISKIKALGWHPEFDLELGVRRTLELEFDL